VRGGADATWKEFGRRFKKDTLGIGACRIIFFGDHNHSHWTLIAGDTQTREWTWFDGYEPLSPSSRSRSASSHRRSGAPPSRRIKGVVQQLSYVMNRAAIEYPDHDGYKKFTGDWTLQTVHADKIPVQTDGWSCGQRVLLLADMLAWQYNVTDMQDMYSDAEMPAIHREMDHYALGLLTESDSRSEQATTKYRSADRS
jgi:hypothetical protein